MLRFRIILMRILMTEETNKFQIRIIIMTITASKEAFETNDNIYIFYYFSRSQNRSRIRLRVSEVRKQDLKMTWFLNTAENLTITLARMVLTLSIFSTGQVSVSLTSSVWMWASLLLSILTPVGWLGNSSPPCACKDDMVFVLDFLDPLFTNIFRGAWQVWAG